MFAVFCSKSVLLSYHYVANTCRCVSSVCYKKKKLEICTEFVNYCEHGRLRFSVLHFRLRYRGTSFNFKVRGGGGRKIGVFFSAFRLMGRSFYLID